MINLLVVEDNLEYSKKLINFLLNNNDMIKLIYMASDGGEALEYLKNEKNKIDIIILDLKIPRINGIEILKKLEINKKDKYKNSIIILSGQNDMLAMVRNNKFIYSYINKIDGFKEVLNEINNLIKAKIDDEDIIEQKILNELKYLKYNDKLIGTKYLLESISILAKNPQLNTDNLRKNVFPIIAIKYKKTIQNIKSNINNATILMNCDCEKEIIMEYFKFTNTSAEAKPKQVINTILDKIKKDLK